MGFLVKDAAASELTLAIRRAMSGERVIEPVLAASTLSDGNNPLTQREREVFAATADGSSVAEVAWSLRLSEGTLRDRSV